MSRIDDTQAAITAAKDKVDEIVMAIQAAMDEAEGTAQTLESVGAEGNAQLLIQCRETLERASQTVAGVSDLLDEAVQQAEAGRG